MILGQLIENYRLTKRISVRDLAGQIGVDHCALFRLEKGKEIDTCNFLKILRWATNNNNAKDSNNACRTA